MNIETLKYLRATMAILFAAILMTASLSAQDLSLDEALTKAKTIYSQKGPRAALPE